MLRIRAGIILNVFPAFGARPAGARQIYPLTNSSFSLTMKRTIIISILYFVILFLIVSIYFTHIQLILKEDCGPLVAQMSTVQTKQMDNLILFTIDDEQKMPDSELFSDKGLFTRWGNYFSDKGLFTRWGNWEDAYINYFPRNGFGDLHCERCNEHYCPGDLQLDLIDIDLRGIDESTFVEKMGDFKKAEENNKIPPLLLQTATLPCSQLHFEEPLQKNVPHGPRYRIIPFGLRGSFVPQSVNTVVAGSTFLPGHANRVFIVNITDGEPYTGPIKVEQILDPSGTDDDIKELGISAVPYTKQNNTYIIQADESGITSMLMTIQRDIKLRFTAGDKSFEHEFVLNERPFNANVIGSFNPKVDLPTMYIDFAGERQDMVIDYFIDNAWFDRQLVHASDTKQFKLTPKYKYISPEKAWNDQIDIIYARVSPSGFPTEEPYQTFAIPASAEFFEDRFEIGAIYQEFVKLHYLNNGHFGTAMDAASVAYDIYTDPNIQQEPWAKEMFALAMPLINRNDREDSRGDHHFSLKDYNYESFMLNRLAQEHDPRVITLPFDDKKVISHAHRTSGIWLVIWLLGGLIAYVICARNIRIRRQRAWFDAAAMGKAKGVMPGIPMGFVYIIALLGMGLVATVYSYIQYY